MKIKIFHSIPSTSFNNQFIISFDRHFYITFILASEVKKLFKNNYEYNLF